MPEAKLPATYTLSLIAGVDVGICAQNCIDIFQIEGDGAPLFRITFDYTHASGKGDEAQVAKVESLTDMRPWDLPFIWSGFQLISKVFDFVTEHQYDAGCEFLAEVFVDEDGNALSLPISFDK